MVLLSAILVHSLQCDVFTFPNAPNADENWLNVVSYSLSTKSGTLAFAHRRKIIVLSNQWDTKSQQFNYSIVWSGELECATDDEITSIACLTVTNDQNEVNAFDAMRRCENCNFLSVCSQALIVPVSWLACRRDICNFSTHEAPFFCRSNGTRNRFLAFYCKMKRGRPSKRST